MNETLDSYAIGLFCADCKNTFEFSHINNCPKCGSERLVTKI